MNVCMVVSNNVVNDVRVMKEARTLVNAGHNITIFGIGDQDKEVTVDNIKVIVTKNSKIDSLIRRVKLKSYKIMPNDLQAKKQDKRLGRILYKVMKGITIIALIKNNAIKIQRKIAKQNKKYDVIHCHDLDTLRVGINIKNKYKDTTLIYDSHELWTEMSGINSVVKKYFKRQESELINKVDYIITVSPSIIDELVKRYSIRKTPILIRNIPDIIENRCIKNNNPYKEIKLIYVGFYLPGRGLENIIDEFKLVSKNVKIYLRINAEEGQILSLIGMIKDRELSKRITILPFVQQNELLEEISNYDIGILPYLPTSLNNRYCLPNKLFQYLSSGLCVLSNELPDVSQILDKYNCGETYDYKVKNNFASKINDLANNIEKLSIYKKNAINAIKSELNWEQESIKLIELYNGIKI